MWIAHIGQKHPISEKTKRKISDAHKWKRLSSEHRQKISEGLKGHRCSKKNPDPEEAEAVEAISPPQYLSLVGWAVGTLKMQMEKSR